MPAGYSESYDYYYEVQFLGVPGNNMYLGAANSGPTTLYDTEDTGDDGSTAIDGQLDWESLDAAAGTTFDGFTVDGDPVVFSNGSLWVLSDNGGLGFGFVAPGADAPYEYCFAQGSLIKTEVGEKPVENITIGDQILNQNGQAVAVKWVGVQTLGSRFGAADRNQLVRFAAGSLGKGIPHRDLTVTSDHAMYVDGVLCHAGALINGHSIGRVPLSEMGQGVKVYHIETEGHEIIMANGAPAETFVDNVSRRAFDNFAEFEALYGDVPEMEELDYPRAMSLRQVPMSIRRKLGMRAAA